MWVRWEAIAVLHGALAFVPIRWHPSTSGWLNAQLIRSSPYADCPPPNRLFAVDLAHEQSPQSSAQAALELPSLKDQIEFYEGPVSPQDGEGQGPVFHNIILMQESKPVLPHLQQTQMVRTDTQVLLTKEFKKRLERGERPVVGWVLYDKYRGKASATGTTCEILDFGWASGRERPERHLKVWGQSRFRVLNVTRSEDDTQLAEATVQLFTDADESKNATQPALEAMRELMIEVAVLQRQMPSDIWNTSSSLEKSRVELARGDLTFAACQHLSLLDRQKQWLVQSASRQARVSFLTKYLQRIRDRCAATLERGGAMREPSVIAKAYSRVAHAVVCVDNLTPRGVAFSRGSGFLIADRMVVTNAHVVRAGRKVALTLHGGRISNGTVVGRHPYADIALIQVDSFPEGMDPPRPATLGHVDQLYVGDWTIAVGHPGHTDPMVSAGIVSSKHRTSHLLDRVVEYVITDAMYQTGFSGGPLVNTEGEVIGINTMMRTDMAGLGFAISIDQVKACIDEIKTPTPATYYDVWLHKDPINRKVDIIAGLREVFGWEKSEARKVANRAAEDFRTVCGTYTYEEALQWAEKLQELDLLVDIEPAP